MPDNSTLKSVREFREAVEYWIQLYQISEMEECDLKRQPNDETHARNSAESECESYGGLIVLAGQELLRELLPFHRQPIRKVIRYLNEDDKKGWNALSENWTILQRVLKRLESEEAIYTRHGDESAEATVAPKKAKRSTERDEGRLKLISGLTKHHEYANGRLLNQEPIGNNELARLADVSGSTASGFFTEVFGGHSKYRTICRDTSRLVGIIKVLNQEFTPHRLFGAKPPSEYDRDDAE